MPWVPSDVGAKGAANRHQPLMYQCDWTDCTRPAEHVAGCVKELGAFAAFCGAHASATGASQEGVKPGRHAYRPWQGF